MADPQIDIKIGMDAREAQKALEEITAGTIKYKNTLTGLSKQGKDLEIIKQSLELDSKAFVKANQEAVKLQNTIKTFQQPIKMPLATSLVPLNQQLGSVNSTMMGLNYTIRDAPFGMMGIQNNIPMLIDGFGKLKTEAGGFGGALKAMAGQLASPMGFSLLVSGITAVYTAYTMGTFNFLKSNEASKESLEKAKKAAQEYASEINSIANNLLKVKSPLENMVFGINQDQLKAVIDEQKSIVKELNYKGTGIEQTMQVESLKTKLRNNEITTAEYLSQLKVLQEQRLEIAKETKDRETQLKFEQQLLTNFEQQLKSLERRNQVIEKYKKLGLTTEDKNETTNTSKKITDIVKPKEDEIKLEAQKVNDIYEKMLESLKIKTLKTEAETWEEKKKVLYAEFEERRNLQLQLFSENKLTGNELTKLNEFNLKYLFALEQDINKKIEKDALDSLDKESIAKQKALIDLAKYKEDQHQKDLARAKELQDGIIGLANNLKQAFNIGADTAFSKFLAIVEMTNQILGNLEKISGKKDGTADMFSKAGDWISGIFTGSGKPSATGTAGTTNPSIVINTYVDGAIIEKKVIESYGTAQATNQRQRRV